MGLDQYAYRTKDARCAGAFKMPEGESPGDLICQWRKHSDLHGWMRELYRTKGSEAQRAAVPPQAEDGDTFLGEEFNASEGVELTAADLDALAAAVEANELPRTKGFFFGQSEPEDRRQDEIFLARARDAIAAGFRVYYTSWW